MYVFLSICYMVLIQFTCATVSSFVKIHQGNLRGKTFITRNGRNIHGFLGIPYAAPPIGDLRFEAPQPPHPWRGTRDASKYANACLQNNYLFGSLPDEIFGSEDCLYLNVYTPKVSSTTYFPVMVWIHGGAYYSGSSEAFIGPEYLLDKNVVLVSINYRLGVFGFLATGDEIFPGNYGMKDQSAALRWVKHNIKYFGGNPESVTICGFSVGAGSVHFHMMSPLSKGLFHAAISESGTALSPWSTNIKRIYKNTVKDVAAIFRCPTADSKLLLHCLRKFPSDTFFKLVNKYVINSTNSMIFRPIVEPYSKEAFLPVHPAKLNTSVPWIVGMTSGEGAMAIAILTRGGTDSVLAYIDKNYDTVMPSVLLIEDKTRSIVDIIKKTRTFYFGNKEINTAAIPGLVNLYTDTAFLYGLNKALQRHKGPAYQYYFDYRGTYTWSPIFGNNRDELGVCHMDDILYLSNIYNFFPNRTLSKNDLEISKKMVELWTNFAIYSNPTPNRSHTVWEPITTPEMEYLHIKKYRFVMEKNLLKERRDFWLSLPINDNPDGSNFDVL